MKWLQKLLLERRERQIKIQDRMVDLENDMKLCSAVVEIAAKEILSIKAILNRNGLNDTVVQLSDEQVKEMLMEGQGNEQS